MKPFTFFKIVLLLFVFGSSNLYAVQTTTITPSPSETESIANITAVNTVKENPRKSKLIEKFKEKFAYLFQKENSQENTSQNDSLETKTHGLAIASLVLGIIGILTAFIGVGFLLALLALIFGAIAKRKIKDGGGFYTGKGMANAGLVLGIIPMAFFIFILFIVFVFGGGF